GRIVLITAEEEPPYDRPTLSKEFMAGQAPRDWLPLHSADFYETWEIELYTGRRVERLRAEERVLAFEDGEELKFDRALLATGGTPRRLNVPGMDLEGCFLLRSLADGEAIASALEGAERAAIIGAGFIGMEVASSLRERGLEVHVVAREQVPLVRVFGEEIGRWLQGLHQEEGVLFHLGETAGEISGDGAVESVALSSGERIAADVVIVGVGVLPVVDYLNATGLVEDGAVPVDGTLKTRADDVWAAGDIAVVPEPDGDRSHRIEHWVVAESHGQHAARAMLGSDELYREAPFFWTRQCGVSLKYVGYPCTPERMVVRGDVQEGDFLAGYYVNGELRAAAGAGRPDDITAVAELLTAGQKVTPEAFADPETDLLGLLEEA
ncbi:MAG: FAD-dependent oxidoreductase, partial [Candidatus Brocadiaceae bacterium]